MREHCCLQLQKEASEVFHEKHQTSKAPGRVNILVFSTENVAFMKSQSARLFWRVTANKISLSKFIFPRYIYG